jgi:hypothetical protein
MLTTPICLSLIVAGTALLFVWAFGIRDRKRRYLLMQVTHLFTIVPGSVALSNRVFPPDDIPNVALALLMTVGIVVVIWFAVLKIYTFKKRLNRPQL